ncbi:MAG: iron-sulfur cluster assembly scaffold protein [Candidatus Promineifilaceae bacterium]
MTDQSDLIKLYSTRILALAAEMPRVGRLEAPNGTAMKRSPLCGSKVTVDVMMTDGKITDFAQDVKACALGQAAASVTAAEVIGLGVADIQTARDGLNAMLKTDGPVPTAPFDGFEVLQPAKDFKNRHASILLALDATLAACQDAETP